MRKQLAAQIERELTVARAPACHCQAGGSSLEPSSILSARLSGASCLRPSGSRHMQLMVTALAAMRQAAAGVCRDSGHRRGTAEPGCGPGLAGRRAVRRGLRVAGFAGQGRLTLGSLSPSARLRDHGSAWTGGLNFLSAVVRNPKKRHAPALRHGIARRKLAHAARHTEMPWVDPSFSRPAAHDVWAAFTS